MSELLDKIRSRGHWQVVIRPHTFDEQRIPDLSDLYPILQRCSVQLRGWNFPHLDYRTQPHRDIDWISQEFQWMEYHYLELWRFYRSGQFIHIAGISSDWYNQSHPKTFLEICDTIFRFTEIFEFAARLAFTAASDDFMHVSITLSGLKDRDLRLEEPDGIWRDTPYQAKITEYPYSVNVPRAELIARPNELALAAAGELFKRFNWDPPPGVLRGWQERLQQIRATMWSA